LLEILRALAPAALVQRKKVSRRRHQNRRYLWRFSHASFLDSVVRKDSRRAQSVMRWNRFEVAPADIRNLFVEMQQLHLDMGVAFDTCVAAPLLHITGFAEGWPTLPFQTPHAATARCSGRLNEQGKKANKTKAIHYEQHSGPTTAFPRVSFLSLMFSTFFYLSPLLSIVSMSVFCTCEISIRARELLHFLKHERFREFIAHSNARIPVLSI
jgi:hypothetical protein